MKKYENETNMIETCYPPTSKVRREGANLPERKTHMVSKNLSICLSVTNFISEMSEKNGLKKVFGHPCQKELCQFFSSARGCNGLGHGSKKFQKMPRKDGKL